MFNAYIYKDFFCFQGLFETEREQLIAEQEQLRTEQLGEQRLKAQKEIERLNQELVKNHKFNLTVEKVVFYSNPDIMGQIYGSNGCSSLIIEFRQSCVW